MVLLIIRATARFGCLGLLIFLATSLALGQHTMPQAPAKPESKTEAPAVKSSETEPGMASDQASQGEGAGMGCMMMSMGGGADDSGCCMGGQMGMGGAMKMGNGGKGMGQGGMKMQGRMAQGQMAQNQGGMVMQGQGQTGQQAAARPGTGHQGFGHGMQATGPRRGTQAQDPQMAEHRDTVHGLLTNNKKIRRSVELLPDGIRSTTESDDPETAALLKKHVPQMYQFVKEGKAVRKWDPLFEEIFKNGDKIKMTVQETEKGVKVTETSKDEKVVALIQEHSKIIDNFVATGWDSAQQEHPLPAKVKGEK